MDRNREGRRAANMAAPPNGLSSSRRRHRSGTLRDSPDEDGTVEVQEPGRLRDRGLVKKDRDRDRDRERERLSRSKRRRENRMVIHHTNTGGNRDDGDDSSEESGNEEEEDDDDDRMLHPSTSASVSVSSNHHHQSHNSNSHTQQQIHHRKSFSPSVSNKVFRAAPAAAPPSWKSADEMIGFSIPRKARTGSGKASAKRTPDWKSGVGGTGIDRQSSTSPVRLASSAASPAPAAPPSPSSSNVSGRKKMKVNGGGSKQPRPPKSSSKSSSSNPEELEIEIAEVLYGLMTQSQAPAKKEIPSSSDTKSRVSSPISNSTAVPQNSTSLSTVAPKRKRPRQVSENPISSSMKTEIDHHHHHHHHQSPKTDISSPYLENNSPASVNPAAENGVSSFGFTTLPGHKATNPSAEQPAAVPQMPAEEERKIGVGLVLTKEEVVKESSTVKLNDGISKNEAVIVTAASTTVTNLELTNLECKKDEKFEIDLMAPPPQQRTSQGSDGDVDFSDHKPMPTQETSKTREDDSLRKGNTEEQKVGTIQETGESSKQGINEEINIQLNINLEKPNKGSANMVSSSSNRSLQQALKHQQFSAKSETHSEKTAQSSSVPMPMANWPPMGYVAPLQGVISMDGNTMASTPFQPQPIFTHPRPKRCATHCYIARNIHCNQQFMKMNPFWPAASASAAPMFGAKPSNLNVMPPTELHANIPQSMQDKGQAVGIFPGYTTGKEAKSSQSANISDPALRKQQVLLQQAMPPVVPNNLLHGPAFIFPFNQQQAVAASASVRPGSSKLTTSTATGGLGAPSGPSNSSTVNSSTTAAAPALSFNYQNMSANETQYLAILQNNPYSFPMPAVGAPPNYRPGPHAQAMPLFNGSFYSSQMIHPSQIPQPPQQQATPPAQAQNHIPTQSQQTHQNSSGSTSSQKHLQAQQRQQGSGATAVNGSGSGNGGSLQSGYHASHKSRPQQPTQLQNLHMNPAQVRHLENEVTGGEDSPSTADSRVSRAANTMGAYNHNFAVPARSKAFGQMDHPNGALTKTAGAAVTTSANSNDKKQQQQQSQQQGLKRGGVEPSLQPQAFAMSFAPMNGTTGNITMAQNHAIFQSMPESVRQGYHMMAAPTAGAHQSQQKDFRISEETPRTGHDSSNAGEKVSSGLTAKSGQSIAFSRPDLATDASGSNNLSSRSPISTSVGTAAQSSLPLHVQYQQQQQQQQQVLQLQKQQQNQNMNNARTKNPSSSNGSVYPEHVITSSSMAAKFPNSISSFPLQTSNTSSSLVQSPQWRNSVRGPTTPQVPSSIASATTTSSLKNLHQPQQQSSRSHPQSHTQISFGATASQKLQPTTAVQMQQQQQQQQQQNLNPSSNSGTQSPSPPMLVGSPTTSFSGSPRTNVSASISGRTSQASSLSSSQPVKNSPVVTQRSSPSILGNPNSNFTKSQQQLPKQTLQQQKAQPMMMYSYPLMQAQAQQHAASSMSPAQAMMMYNHPARLQQQQQQSSQQQSSSSSTAMLSLSPPVTLANTATSDPAKAIAAATSMMNHTQYSAAAAQSMPAGFPQYVHNAPATTAVQVKPAEQKQPAA